MANNTHNPPNEYPMVSIPAQFEAGVIKQVIGRDGCYFKQVILNIIARSLFRNPGGMMNMLKKSSEIDVSKVDTKFIDVAGCEEAKFELIEVVDFNS